MAALKAKALCNVSDRYHCLTDANKIRNIEACRNNPQFDAPGYKIQIVGSLEGVQCASDRYQPFIFWTNGSYLCKFEKSLCHGEGEVRFSLGTTTEDRACRCDYTNGYDFVVSPNHTCFCMPTEEDCSCFMRQCPSGFVLSPDYDCAPVHKLLEKSRCPLISTVDNTQPSTQPKDEGDQNHNYQNVLVRGRSLILTIVVSILLVPVLLIIGIGFFIAFPLGKLIGINHILSVCFEYMCCIQFSSCKKSLLQV
ncbi:uncharacterized protein LOC143042987 [Mytilus galloprovincialis]|uniref:uncharacterized protein LOC143042987 n=1 Tax=Mytilus galloprovincialis TaxID=29158 RepID=UPI003F7CB69B